MDFDLYFGKVHLHVNADFFQGFMSDKMALFAHPVDKKKAFHSVQYRVKLEKFKVPDSAKVVWRDEDMRVLEKSGCTWRVFRYLGESEDYAVVKDAGKNEIACYIMPGKEKYFPSTFHLQPLLLLDSVLIRNGAFILHAANVIWKGKSILFFGPSGIGKSTQARLWEHYEHAEIINGDRTLIQKEQEHYDTYGISWCGSSDICKNKKAKLGALVYLKQAEYNQITELKGMDACKAVMSEAVISSWNLRDKNLLLDQVTGLLEQSSVLQLSCTPESSATECLKNYLEADW